jgi:integrase/recombinase XerC
MMLVEDPKASPERGSEGVASHALVPLERWVHPPHPVVRQDRARGVHQSREAKSQQLIELVDQFCQYQRKQRGKTEGGVATYRWNLNQFQAFVRARTGRVVRIRDLTEEMIQAWMDDMAAADLAINTLRCRQASLSSFCSWLVKRKLLPVNPVAAMDRPPHQRVPPAVPAPCLMDALVQAAKAGGRPRDVAIFLLLRYTGMRREAVATLRIRHLDGN